MVDAHGLGPCVRKDLGVRLLFPAHIMETIHLHKSRVAKSSTLLIFLIPTMAFLVSLTLLTFLFKNHSEVAGVQAPTRSEVETK